MADEIDPKDFVQRIRELGEQRDQQDAERVRKLEEELIQGRSERLARRAERARSISPDKLPHSPQSLPSAAGTPRNIQEKAASTPTPTMKPPQTHDNARDESLSRLTGSPAPTTLEDVEPKKPATSAAALGRSGTLSWKQRPQSGSLRRPLSMVASSADRARSTSPTKTPDTKTPEPSSPEPAPSRSSIAASLASKDPAYFRQTADRGLGSAAYRRSQEETASDTGSVSNRRQLPGMSRESTVEPEISSPPPESVRSSSPGSRGGSTRGSAMLSNRFSTNTSLSGGDTEPARTRSPLPIFESQKFAPPSEEVAESADRSRAMAMSPTQGRISPERERSTSPTKGMGGFVQSAMLKRSDSVSKRWSTQTPPALNRQSSTVSNRGSAMAGYGSLSSRPASTLSRDNSTEPSSRPTSSHGTITASKEPEKERTSRDQFVKPALPYHSRSKSVHSTFSEKDKQEEDGDTPSSPSKRWSPTKSSWLESALNKPDSPKPKQAPPAQPAWMAEINRIKQQRSSVDIKGTPQSSSNDVFSSGRTSPIKDVQLKPAGLRKFEVPKQDATPEEKPATFRKIDTPKKESPPEVEDKEKLATPSTKPKPVLSPKPSLEKKEEAPKAEEAASTVLPTAEISNPVKEEPPTETAEPAPPSPTKVTSRFPPVKPKPDTAPKTDFRAGLKSRQPVGDASKTGQVTELQNVFGKLRKAETKNYVAPDVLKSNILQGKSALTVTGGPKPTVRRDDFRDSLVRKKSQMLEKAQESGSTLKRSESPSKPEATPEALVRRKTLGQRDAPKPDFMEKPKVATPEALMRQKSLKEKKVPVDDRPVQPEPLPTAKEPAMSSKLAGRFNPALAGMLARGPPGSAMNKSSSSADATESSSRPTEPEKTRPAPELQHMTKGRARGPKRRAPAKQASTTSEEATQPNSTPIVTAVPLVKPEHVLPSSKPSITDGTPEEISVKKTPVRQSLVEKPATPAKSPRIASGQFGKATPEPPKKPISLELEEAISASEETPKRIPHQQQPTSSPRTSSPGIPKKPTSLESERRVSGNFSTPQKSPLPQVIRDTKPASPIPSPKPGTSRFSRPLPSPPVAENPKPAALKEIAPPNVELTPAKDERSPDKSTFSSVKNATSLWGRQSTSSSPVTPKVKAPIKLPTKADERAAMEDAGLVRSPEPQYVPSPVPKSPLSPLESKPLPQPPKPKPAGLGFSLGGLSSYLPARSRESSPQLPAKNTPASPPVSAGRPQSEPPKPLPVKHDGMFADFFDEAPVTEGTLPEHIDTIHLLRNPPLDLSPSGKIRTLRKQIHEVTGDGKLTPVPMQEEHILFQHSMYLCTHIYGDSKGAKQTDVYLWTGNGVAELIVEDVQLFARNYAKQNQGRLVLVRQGQESPNFFDALGGIVITRRGARPPTKEFMLCGRRHLGHLAFDEVDYSLKSLCSAFAYLISTSEGKVYLWKGRGCSAEELSGARLMGMDLAPTGDFTEVDESSEPQDFINMFPPPAVPTKGPLIPRSADHWRYKATSDKYRVRLYKIEQTQASGGWGQALQTPITPKTPGGVTINVREIMPFSQRDLEPENVYVLDAFFEMYIIIGALSRTQHQAFSTALLFAQEYGILAVSEEDRPFMPVTTVVMEGVPRDMKAVFRHWDDALIPAAGLMRGKLGRGKSLRIVGLEKAIEATRR